MKAATSTAIVSVFASFQYLIFFVLLTLVSETHAVATVNDWRSRSIYQVITDRFARSDGSITAPCDVSQQKYCGGTWRGIINKLDYIQGMGFNAVS